MPIPIARHIASRIIRLLPRTGISHLVGQVCDIPLPPSVSRAVVKTYGAVYRVDMSDVIPRSTPYESFDAYFTRRLQPGRRPLDDEGGITSPADGELQALGRVEDGCRIVAKGRSYDLARLVGNEDDARALVGGQFAVVYLSPRDYHRVHAPISGVVPEVRGLPGDLFPVNAVGEHCTRSLLVDNQRVVIPLDTENLGRVLLVMVGAMVVGRITVAMLPDLDVPAGVHLVDPPYAAEQGEEVGIFHLGSTVVVLAGPEAPAWHRPLGLIRVGESLMRVE